MTNARHPIPDGIRVGNGKKRFGDSLSIPLRSIISSHCSGGPGALHHRSPLVSRANPEIRTTIIAPSDLSIFPRFQPFPSGLGRAGYENHRWPSEFPLTSRIPECRQPTGHDVRIYGRMMRFPGNLMVSRPGKPAGLTSTLTPINVNIEESRLSTARTRLSIYGTLPSDSLSRRSLGIIIVSQSLIVGSVLTLFKLM